MHKNATKCKQNIKQLVLNKHGTSKIIDTFATYQASIHLSPRPDVFRWNLHANGGFFIDSLYHVILWSNLPMDNNKKTWKMKIPLETNIFAWYLRHGVILTKDNLVNITGMEV
jgi:hypothetical protein